MPTINATNAANDPGPFPFEMFMPNESVFIDVNTIPQNKKLKFFIFLEKIPSTFLLFLLMLLTFHVRTYYSI